MLEFDFSAFERAAERLGGAIDQVPFALANTLNDAMFDARRKIVNETWPAHVQVRNPTFINAALRVRKASKHHLEAAIYQQPGVGTQVRLKMHEKGGTKVARGRFAVPSDNVRLTQHGASRPQRPANLRNKVVIGNRIFQAVGKGKRRKLKLMYTLVRSVRVPATVPFFRDFASEVMASMARHFPEELARAMKTRRAR